LLLTVLPGAVLETEFAQVAPAVPGLVHPVRSQGQDRAVVLIQGMYVNPLNKEGAARAALRTWQKPGSLLVTRLTREADVFAFAYSQTVAADELAEWPDLVVAVNRLRRAGYREVVLVGHSAGGLIARHCVENYPDLGVDKVIQVCSPNTGSGWAKVAPVRPYQGEFVASLTKEVRRRALHERGDRLIPPQVQFACVVGNLGLGGDGLVSCASAWSEDLQRQGVPAYVVAATHWQAVRSAKGADVIADLVRRPLPRWTPAEVEKARHSLFKLARKAAAP
jgi:pimeloyl-ACP methyl ester carboxylesterase